MKENRNERLSEQLSDVDDTILEEAYAVDDPEKLKQYIKKEKAKRTPFFRTPLFRRLATAAACLLLVVGLLLSYPLLFPKDDGPADGSGPADGTGPVKDVDYRTYFIATAAPKIDPGRDYARAEYQAFLEKLDLFAAKLTYEVYSDSDKQRNVCISPVSVYMALALAVECTEGTSRQEILDAVGVTYDEVKSFTRLLYAYSNRDTYYFTSPDAWLSAEYEELANSIWVDKDVSFKQAGVDSLAENYHCDSFYVDLGSEEGDGAIASYIKDKTHGLIDGAIDLPPEAFVTLINTFYLNDTWNAFERALSFTDTTYDFRNADGSTVATRLVEGNYFDGKVYEGEGYTSFYTQTSNSVRLKVLLPKEGYTLSEVFTAENIYAINNVTDYGYQDDKNYLLHHTRLLFPEFEASYDGDLSAILKEDFAVTSVFDLEKSDFSGITEDQVALENIVHKCRLKVDERGIEGAGATFDGVYGGEPPLEYVDIYHDFVVDRAFGFVITDSYGSVLFAGAVNTLAR